MIENYKFQILSYNNSKFLASISCALYLLARGYKLRTALSLARVERENPKGAHDRR